MVTPLHTAFASQALELADVFRMFVGTAPINGTDGRPFMAQLSTPHGPSTGGGAQHVQHITFSREGRTFVVGSIDTKGQQIELRGHESVSRQHQQRFKAPLVLTAVEYDLFVKRVRAFANSKQMAVLIKEVVAFEGEASAGAADEATSSMAWLGWLLVILVAGAIAAIVVLT